MARFLDLLFRKQRQIESLVFAYLDLWEECLEGFESAMHTYLDRGLGEEFEFLVGRTHRAESAADDQRRKIEYEMYSRALLPESRGDILRLLESLDSVLGAAQAALFSIVNERIGHSRTRAREMRELVDVSLECTRLLLGLARGIFGRGGERLRVIREIDEKESRCDFLERRLISSIFASTRLEGWRQLQLRDLVVKLSEISDRAERASDRLLILSLERRV